MMIEQLGNFYIVEAFNLHHMTPVTGGVTDREKNRLVLCLSCSEGLITPGEPVHWIVCVLQQIGRIFFNQPIYEYRTAFCVEVFCPFVIGALPLRFKLTQTGFQSRRVIRRIHGSISASTVNQICKLLWEIRTTCGVHCRADDPSFQYRRSIHFVQDRLLKHQPDR